MRFTSIGPPPTYVGSWRDVDAAVRRCEESVLLGVDTETLGLLKDPSTGRKYHKMSDRVVVMGLSPDEHSRMLVPARLLHHFKELLANDTPKALTNIKFDAHRLANTAGITLGGRWVDTVRLDILLDEDTREFNHGLKACARDYFGINMQEYKELFGSMDPREFVPGHPMWEKYLDYSSLDPWVTRNLAIFQLEKLEKIKVWGSVDSVDLTSKEISYTMEDMYWETEEPDLKVLYAMERRGIKTDLAKLQSIEHELDDKMQRIGAELSRKMGAPFNPNSGKQIAEFLFSGLGLTPRGYTPSGAPKTDAKSLEYFAAKGVEECLMIVEYKRASKLKGTYAQGLQKWTHTDGRVHTSYSTKSTGRLASADPNLQNLPRPDNDPMGIRESVVPEAGNVLIVNDYSQLEMCIAAFAAYTYGDDTMLVGIENGLDMHSRTACEMLGVCYEAFIELKKAADPDAIEMRTAAKSVGFGILYGATCWNLSLQLTEKLGRPVSENEAQRYIDMYLNTYWGIAEYMKDTIRHGYQHGYVQTIRGRFRRLSALKGGDKRARGHAERQAVNARIQGSAADIVKAAMLKCDTDKQLAELGFYMILQVHDELVFEGPIENAKPAAARIQELMEMPFDKKLPFPLRAEPVIVDNWAAAKG